MSKESEKIYMAERTAEECRLMLAEYWAKESGFEFKLDEHSKPVYFFKLKPKVTSHFPDITDSNWLDEIEDMLIDKRIIREIFISRHNPEYWRVVFDIWLNDVIDKVEAIVPTLELALARCLCKVIEEVNNCEV